MSGSGSSASQLRFSAEGDAEAVRPNIAGAEEGIREKSREACKYDSKALA